MSTELRSMRRGFVETFVLGNADDLPSTNWLLIVSRVTHWVCFVIALCAALKFANLYFTNGNLWNSPPEEVSDRQLLQLVANQSLWLFVAGVALLGGFITWLNTDVLLNRKIMLEQRVVKETYVNAPAAMESDSTMAMPSSEHLSRS